MRGSRGSENPFPPRVVCGLDQQAREPGRRLGEYPEPKDSRPQRSEFGVRPPPKPVKQTTKSSNNNCHQALCPWVLNPLCGEPSIFVNAILNGRGLRYSG